MRAPGRRLLHALERLGLLERAFRAYEALKAARFIGKPPVDSGLPLPPARLRVRVAGTSDPAWFVESGRLTAETVRSALARHGVDLAGGGSVLDFGCGCGRVVRHFRDLTEAELHGSDSDDAVVRWCSENLPFASFRRNALEPPAPYDDRSYAAIYAVSVLTHLPERLQLAWLSDLRRMLRPDGLLVVTTHGDRYVEQLTGPERRAYEAGNLVVRWESAAGTNLCTAFHPDAYVRGRLAAGFELVELVAEGAAGTPYQNLVVLRRPAESPSDQRPSSRTGPAASPAG